MGKAAAATAGAVAVGMATFVGLAGLLPVAWAEGGALMITGLSMLGAGLLLDARRTVAPTPPTETVAPTTVVPVQRAQEA